MTTPDLPDWAEPLGLAPHPEGGWFVETYRAATTVDVLTESGTTSTRPTATLIQFLLLPGEQSAWHRVTSDEVWILLRGGRLALDLGGDGETPGNVERIVLGPDTTREVLQGTVPAGVWQRAEPLDDEPVLVSCMVTPGFVFDDFTLLDEDAG